MIDPIDQLDPYFLTYIDLPGMSSALQNRGGGECHEANLFRPLGEGAGVAFTRVARSDAVRVSVGAGRGQHPVLPIRAPRRPSAHEGARRDHVPISDPLA